MAVAECHVPSPNPYARFYTVVGYKDALWTGSSTTYGPQEIAFRIPTQVTSIFRLNNAGQSWQFWYLGFPDSFQTIQNLIHGESYLFYGNGVAWVAEW